MKIAQCLPSGVAEVVERYHSSIRELRVRADKPVRINVNGNWYYVNRDKLVVYYDGVDIITQQQVDDIINIACNNSIFAYERQLASGFMTIEEGVRIGVCGSVVMQGDKILCMSQITSLCIRFARHIANCSNAIDTKCKHTIIIGKPGSGKTTFLRDIACRLSQEYNCIVIDDRGEISGCCDFDKYSYNVDIMNNGDKTQCMNLAIRSLSPQCIITDEINSNMYPAIKEAMASGVHIYATMHGDDHQCLSRLHDNGIIFDECVFMPDIVGDKPSVYQINDNGIVLC